MPQYIAQWGPIIIPSDNVLSVFVGKNGAKWFGTDMGVAMHTGSNTLENWSVYTMEEGLINDIVQSIGSDKKDTSVRDSGRYYLFLTARHSRAIPKITD